MKNKVDNIKVRGARVHNLKNIDVDIPLNKVVGIAGVSGSGKSSLALGVLYSEGSRRYLDALSTYTRRRMTQSEKALVDEVLYVPASLALHQRPTAGGIRSTFGTGTELLNILRLMFSRLANHRCPNGHYLEPTIKVASEQELVCPVCGAKFFAPSAEELAFNSQGACKTCGGTGIVRTVDRATLVPDESLTLDEGAVAPWGTLMWSLMTDVCREMGVRTDIPFKDLTGKEKDIVYNGPAEKKHIFYKAKNTNQAGELDFTYYNAVYTVENALSKVKDEKSMKRVEKFLRQDVCPDCNGSRLSQEARYPKLLGITLDKACEKTLEDIVAWVKGVPESMPNEMKTMANSIVDSFLSVANRLLDLGLGYLSLDRASNTLSTGERQRMQLARAVRNRTTGVLYVLDEPSIGLHPSNIVGLVGVIDDLIKDGNSVILVDHDTEILSKSDWIIEMGEKAGIEGGYIISQGTVEDVEKDKKSLIGKFLSGEEKVLVNEPVSCDKIFELGKISLETNSIHTVKPLKVEIPKGRLTVVTGVSGSGKTTMVLESLVPALDNFADKKKLPEHVKGIDAEGIKSVKLIDATPIGINVRSTVATYANIHDELRKFFAKLDLAKDNGYKAGVDIPCPECNGSRYSKEAYSIKYKGYSLPEIMSMDVNTALGVLGDLKVVRQRLEVLKELGLGYLTLGEATPSLSGGEAQRLKLASEMRKAQTDTVFVFDEPTIGLHPLDVRTLLEVFKTLVDNGATVVVIEHDLDVIRNADWVIDMGPDGGDKGGEIVFSGTVKDLRTCKTSKTAKFV